MRKTAFVVLALALVGIVAAAGCISTETQSPEGYWTLPGTDVLMTITPEGSVLGKAPVNLFSGFCTVEGDRISFNIGATLMTDSEEERAFFAALNSADSFKIVDGKLGGAVKTFTIAGNFFELLKSISALSNEVEVGVSGGFTTFGAPAVLIRDMSVAGK